MHRALLALVVAGNLTVAAADIPLPSTPPAVTKIAVQPAPQSGVKVSNPQKAATQANEDSRLKRYSMLLATFVVMGAIALRRTGARKP
jgi:hypothetical protein